MKELKVKCPYFPDKFCHPGCTNYDENMANLLRTAKNFNMDPNEVTKRVNNDLKTTLTAKFEAIVNPMGLLSCSENPIQ